MRFSFDRLMYREKTMPIMLGLLLILCLELASGAEPLEISTEQTIPKVRSKDLRAATISSEIEIAHKLAGASHPECTEERNDRYNLVSSIASKIEKESTDALHVESGNVLIQTNTPLRVKTTNFLVYLPKDAIALFEVSSGAERVFCLSEGQGVWISVGDWKRSLHTAQACSFANHSPKSTEIFPGTPVRRVLIINPANSHSYVLISEFRVNSCVTKEPALVFIAANSKNGAHQKLLRRIIMESIKNNDLSHGNYSLLE